MDWKGGQRIDRHYNPGSVVVELTEQTNVNILGGKYDTVQLSTVPTTPVHTMKYLYHQVPTKKLAHAVKSDGVTAPKKPILLFLYNLVLQKPQLAYHLLLFNTTKSN